MDLRNRAVQHILEVARIPSFSSYEERLHPYIHDVFSDISQVSAEHISGNNLLYRVSGSGNSTIALTAHLDKINHYGTKFPESLPVKRGRKQMVGAMDDSAGLGILLALAEYSECATLPDLLFFFSEMEESKGLKEHPELLKNNGDGYKSGMGARAIAEICLERAIIPDEIITIDTTPLFKGEPGMALYSKHWELNKLSPSEGLINRTKQMEQDFLSIDDSIKIDNNTNDYLHYGEVFNRSGRHIVPSIYPYHQQGEKVFINDIYDVLDVLISYLQNKA